MPASTPREVLTPDALALLQTVARTGSFAAAASELLREGERLLGEVDAVANRVRRVATGWESQLTIAVDVVVSPATMMELAQAFFDVAPQTRLRLRDDSLSGTLQAIVRGEADLALGVALETGATLGLQSRALGEVPFVFAVAPHHPIAAMPEPVGNDVILQHRAVAVADSVQNGAGVTMGLLAGQDVFTVPTMRAKLDAQLRGIGVGFLPEPMARPYLDTGRLVARQVRRPTRVARMSYVWREGGALGPGRGLQWWLAQLESKATRDALLHRHASALAG